MGTLSMLADEFVRGLAQPLWVVFLRLLGAAVLCALLGLERQQSEHSAGLRTHMLVGLAAATFALVALNLIAMFGSQGPGIRMDPIRLIEAVTAGIAFLAAGMIVLSKGEVRNLTTGAGMWLAGAIGLAAGLGFWPLAVFAALLGLLITGLLGRFEHRRRPPDPPEGG